MLMLMLMMMMMMMMKFMMRSSHSVVMVQVGKVKSWKMVVFLQNNTRTFENFATHIKIIGCAIGVGRG